MNIKHEDEVLRRQGQKYPRTVGLKREGRSAEGHKKKESRQRERKGIYLRSDRRDKIGGKRIDA